MTKHNTAIIKPDVKIVESIMDAIETDDKETLSKLFAQNVIDITPNFDEKLTRLMEYMDGAMVSYEGNSGEGSGVIGEEQTCLWERFMYDIVTTEQCYRMTIEVWSMDSTDPKNVGIHSLSVIGAEDDADRDIPYSGDSRWLPGIYFDVVYVDLMDTIMTAIGSKDADAIRELFVPDVVSNDPNFDEDIERLMEYVQGEYLSYESWGSAENEYGSLETGHGMYTVTTTAGTYRFNINEYIRDKGDLANIGIYSLYVIDSADNTDVDQWAEYNWMPGINVNILVEDVMK